MITTLYGPHVWAAEQKFLGDRDLDSSRFYNLAEYILDWNRYLPEQKIPLKYISI